MRRSVCRRAWIYLYLVSIRGGCLYSESSFVRWLTVLMWSGSTQVYPRSPIQLWSSVRLWRLDSMLHTATVISSNGKERSTYHSPSAVRFAL